MGDDLGNRMKSYESAETGRRLMPHLPICIRVDGKAFHALTRALLRPYDRRFCDLMHVVAVSLALKLRPQVVYVQSDEISLVFDFPLPTSELPFGGKIFKLTSIVASMATAAFDGNREKLFATPPLLTSGPGLFDCRVWNVPSLSEATNMLIWRQQDATRNSIQMAARAVYSHKQCYKKSGADLQEMLHQKGINWNDYPPFFKRGRLLIRQKVERIFTEEERARIPEPHRPLSGQTVVRHEYVDVTDWPPLTKIANREEALFSGVETQLEVKEDVRRQ